MQSMTIPNRYQSSKAKKPIYELTRQTRKGRQILQLFVADTPPAHVQIVHRDTEPRGVMVNVLGYLVDARTGHLMFTQTTTHC